MTNRFKKLLPIINRIVSYIENKVGGTVFPSDDGELKAVTFKWKKYDIKTKEMLQLSYKISYLELECAVEPISVGKKIVDKIKKGE